MPTSEERREVAARLRSVDYRRMIELGLECGSQVKAALYVIGLAVGIDVSDETQAGNLFDRLADLIEPEPERTCHVVTTERKISQTQTLVTKLCSRCGHVFGSEEHRPLLPGFDEEAVLDEVRIPRYCPDCGAEVVDE